MINPTGTGYDDNSVESNSKVTSREVQATEEGDYKKRKTFL
jgi:hypothetical protein